MLGTGGDVGAGIEMIGVVMRNIMRGGAEGEDRCVGLWVWGVWGYAGIEQRWWSVGGGGEVDGLRGTRKRRVWNLNFNIHSLLDMEKLRKWDGGRRLGRGKGRNIRVDP